MPLSPLARLAVHWLLVISMITASAAVPAQAASEAWLAVVASQPADTMTDMPCEDAPTAAQHEMPCDCCTPASCDLAACVGTACLPDLPRMAAQIPPPVIPVPWNAAAPPSRLIDTPLRPPIA